MFRSAVLCLVCSTVRPFTEFAAVSPQVAHLPQRSPATGPPRSPPHWVPATHSSPLRATWESPGTHGEIQAADTELVLTLVIMRKSFRSSTHKGSPQNKLIKKETTLKVSGKRKLTVKFSSFKISVKYFIQITMLTWYKGRTACHSGTSRFVLHPGSNTATWWLLALSGYHTTHLSHIRLSASFSFFFFFLNSLLTLKA